jgi:replicative DNA helicase
MEYCRGYEKGGLVNQRYVPQRIENKTVDVLLSDVNRGKFEKFLYDCRNPRSTQQTGFNDFDDQVRGGGFPGDTLFYIYAKSGVGKTYFALNWVYRLLKAYQNINITFFSLETSYDLLMERFLQLVLKQSLSEVIESTKKHGDYIMKELEKLNFYERVTFHDNRGTYFDIESIDKTMQCEQSDWYFLDHLHKIKNNNKSIFEETKFLSGELQSLKTRHNARFVSLVQVHRNPDKKVEPGTKMPNVESGLGGGSLEQDADIILGLCRPEPEVPVIDGILLKNKIKSKDVPIKMKWKHDKTSELKEYYLGDSW